MQYVVCYDIADDGRRSRIASALLDFGARVQESVFVANLDEQLASRMLERLAKLTDAQYDRVHVFEMCGACSKRTQVIGSAELVEDREYYII
jgi:CRISPR-associated protein Cas2